MWTSGINFAYVDASCYSTVFCILIVYHTTRILLLVRWLNVFFPVKSTKMWMKRKQLTVIHGDWVQRKFHATCKCIQIYTCLSTCWLNAQYFCLAHFYGVTKMETQCWGAQFELMRNRSALAKLRELLDKFGGWEDKRKRRR